MALQPWRPTQTSPPPWESLTLREKHKL
jgi:hypothetical protein